MDDVLSDWDSEKDGKKGEGKPKEAKKSEKKEKEVSKALTNLEEPDVTYALILLIVFRRRKAINRKKISKKRASNSLELGVFTSCVSSSLK
jgi:hypothetical protein